MSFICKKWRKNQTYKNRPQETEVSSCCGDAPLGKASLGKCRGRFWNRYQLLASGRLPQRAFILRRSLWGSKFQETNKYCFLGILIESSSQEYAEAAVAGPLWGLGARAAWPSSGTTAVPPALCTFVRQPTLHLPVMNTHVLHLLAFFCQILSPSLCWLSSRAISANMLYMVISSTALSFPEVDVIRKKVWKHVPSISSTSRHGEDENIQ